MYNEAGTMIEKRKPRGRLLRGARAIAGHVYGSEEHWRSIYNVVSELPIFLLGGLLCAYDTALDEAMARKEAAGKEPTATQMRRSAKFASCDRETV
jgi:hypothetical protein